MLARAIALALAVRALGIADVARAYETDQLTGRERQLPDATDAANAVMHHLLARALDAVDRSACQAPDEALRATLADAIHRATSRPKRVPERGLLRSPGYSVFSASLEDDPSVPRFAFADRADIYGGVGLWQSVVLATAGPCSTYEVGGVRLGSDKFDHFLAIGYDYFRDVARTGSVQDAVARGTGTERSIFGLLTSKTFSFADLRANWDGYRFYAGLLGPDSVVQRRAADAGPDAGCPYVARPFDWRDWVVPEWDEVINPPVYTRLVEQRVLDTLSARRDEVCAARDTWDPDRWREDLVNELDRAPYVVGPAPARRDPWQLATLCDPAHTGALDAAEIRPRVEVREQRREGVRARTVRD